MEETLAEENGHATDGMILPRQTVPFTIGGETVLVPSLRFWDMDELKDELKALTPEAYWVDYAGAVLRIVAHQVADSRPELTYDELKKRCGAGEAMGLAATMNSLLWASGFPQPAAETAPANPGTGTSIGSAPVLPLAASVEDIPSS